MRGSLAAACAAVLVGLSPAGALPVASFAVAAAAQSETTAYTVDASARASFEPASSLRAQRQSLGGELRVRVPAIFRSPSGPAPSQAPPAA